jgi:hypothetical protein
VSGFPIFVFIAILVKHYYYNYLCIRPPKDHFEELSGKVSKMLYIALEEVVGRLFQPFLEGEGGIPVKG